MSGTGTYGRWLVHRLDETDSTNDDAADGAPWEAWTARSQRKGRGRIGHKWLSKPGENLMLSAVVPLPGDVSRAATLPLAAGLAVARAVAKLVPASAPPPQVKWPNDVLAGGRKIAGILCERRGGCAIVGIGLNVLQKSFPPEISARAVSLALCGSSASVDDALETVLGELAAAVDRWSAGGFEEIWPEVASLDALKGRFVSVRRDDSDAAPVEGVCGGINKDGSLSVDREAVWAGEPALL